MSRAQASANDTLSDIEQHGPELPRLELREIHSYASNFCIRRINTGQRHYLATLLNLYKWALDHKVLPPCWVELRSRIR